MDLLILIVIKNITGRKGKGQYSISGLADCAISPQLEHSML